MSETCRGYLWDKIIVKLFASSWYIFLTLKEILISFLYHAFHKSHLPIILPHLKSTPIQETTSILAQTPFSTQCFQCFSPQRKRTGFTRKQYNCKNYRFCMISFGCFTGVWILYSDVSEHCLFRLHRQVGA